jgi:hypothetical protein
MSDLSPLRTGALVLGFALISFHSHAADATLLGVSKSWKTFTAGTTDDKVCYAIVQPIASSPKRYKREQVGFLLNDWPAKKAKAEPEIVPGYKYKTGSDITVQVGGQNFTFYANNDGDSGNGWMKNVTEEERLVDAMQKSPRAVVTGISSRGTKTYDTYALDGLSDALGKIHTACNMQ